MNKLWLITLPILMSAIGLACFIEGAIYAYDHTDPVVRVQPIRYMVIKEVEKPVYITHTVEKPIEVIKYRNIFPRQFESVEQFKQWYYAQDFRTYFNGADCDDYAEDLQMIALQQGYSISQALTLWGQYCGIKVNDVTKRHAGNLALIDNVYFYVEPQPDNFKVVRIINRD